MYVCGELAYPRTAASKHGSAAFTVLSAILQVKKKKIKKDCFVLVMTKEKNNGKW